MAWPSPRHVGLNRVRPLSYAGVWSHEYPALRICKAHPPLRELCFHEAIRGMEVHLCDRPHSHWWENRDTIDRVATSMCFRVWIARMHVWCFGGIEGSSRDQHDVCNAGKGT